MSTIGFSDKQFPLPPEVGVFRRRVARNPGGRRRILFRRARLWRDCVSGTPVKTESSATSLGRPSLSCTDAKSLMRRTAVFNASTPTCPYKLTRIRVNSNAGLASTGFTKVQWALFNTDVGTEPLLPLSCA